jgi:hypothetical protein
MKKTKVVSFEESVRHFADVIIKSSRFNDPQSRIREIDKGPYAGGLTSDICAYGEFNEINYIGFKISQEGARQLLEYANAFRDMHIAGVNGKIMGGLPDECVFTPWDFGIEAMAYESVPFEKSEQYKKCSPEFDFELPEEEEGFQEISMGGADLKITRYDVELVVVDKHSGSKAALTLQNDWLEKIIAGPENEEADCPTP